ncbi:hypothetical protein P9112_002300 [Eukaryota sp. TZLM1-RC]
MCKSHRIESFLEPLLSSLFDAEDDFHKNNRDDVILPGLDGSFILLDVMSVDPCNASNERLVNSEIHNALSNAENFKFKKYNEPLSKLASLLHAKYNLYPFVFSLFGSLAPTVLRFLDDFEMIVKRRTGRNLNRLDQIYVMCKSYRVDSFLEPLLSKLILDDPNIDSTRYNRASMGLTRGDLAVRGLNGSFTILDAMSIDPCNSSNEHFINSDVNNPLLAGEKYKIAKYAKPISSVNENSHAQYNLCPFVFSLLGSLGKAAMAFLEDFVVVVKERTERIFNRVYWQNRIVFSIFKGIVKLISDSLSSFGKFSESLAINCFDVGEAGFEDVEF